MQDQGAQRLTALDGLRGWAALSVLVYHFSWESFGALFPVFRGYPSAVAGNPLLAIDLFYVLSGYVLTRARWGNARGNLGLTLVSRYLRLALPILVAALITCLIGMLSIDRAAEAGAIVGREKWLGRFLNFDPSVIEAIRFSFVDVFFVGIAGKYDPFLWTMIIELWGSVVVLTLSQFRPRAWQAIILILVAVGALRFYPMVAAMPLGALLALLDSRDRVPMPGRGLLPVLAALALWLAAGADIYFHAGTGTNLTQVVLAFGLVFIARANNDVSAFLSNRFSRWLGHLSFPNYLAQFAVLVTLTSSLILLVNNAGQLNEQTALAISLFSIAATFTLAHVFVPIEVATKQFTRMVRNGRAKIVPAAKSA